MDNWQVHEENERIMATATRAATSFDWRVMAVAMASYAAKDDVMMPIRFVAKGISKEEELRALAQIAATVRYLAWFKGLVDSEAAWNSAQDAEDTRMRLNGERLELEEIRRRKGNRR